MISPRDDTASARIVVTLFTAVLMLLGSAGVWIFNGSEDSASPTTDEPLYPATRGDLPISLKLKGVFQAAEAEEVRFEAQGRANITWLIEEGARVKKGDKVVELDATNLLREIENLETTVENAKTQLAVAKANEVISRLESQSRIRKAEMDLEMAGLDLKRFQSKDGTREKEIRDAQLAIEQARVRLEKAESIHGNMPKLHKQGFVTKEEMAESALAVSTARNTLDTARLESKILKEYTHPMMERRLTNALAQAEAELKRYRMVDERVTAQAVAAKASAEQNHQRQVERLDGAKKRLTKMTLYAPGNGIVIYGGRQRRWWHDPIRVGSFAYRHQVLMQLPNLNTMQVVVHIHEADIGRVRADRDNPQRVKVTSDTLPGRQFSGYVRRMATVAESERGREYVRRFASTIELDEQIPEIRPGMTAGVEILIAELKDVLFVPIQAVQTHRGSSYCFVLTDNQPERREVVAGHSSNELVEIKEGLHEGELVLLAPPRIKPDSRSENEEEPATAFPEARNDEAL